MDLKASRWQKVRQLILKSGGLPNFARRINRSTQHVWQFAGPNPSKGIGNKIARAIEESFELDPGYLDRIGPDTSDLSVAAANPVEAIRKAALSAEKYIEARNIWLTNRPLAVHFARTQLRQLLLVNNITITKDTDESFWIDRHGETLRIDLFIPLPGFHIYRYKATESMQLPVALAIPVCVSDEKISFYIVPQETLEDLPNNHEISLDDNATLLNGVDISHHLNTAAFDFLP